MVKKNQKIKCDVSSCKFNDCDKEVCELSEIKVGCDCRCDNPNCKDDTVCDSYEEIEKES